VALKLPTENGCTAPPSRILYGAICLFFDCCGGVGYCSLMTSFKDANTILKSTKYTSLLRMILLITLTFTGLTSGGLCYYFIRHSQTLYEVLRFTDHASDHFNSIKQLFQLQIKANIALATAVSIACPTSAQWPNCPVPSLDFLSQTSSLSSMSGIMLFTVSPIVQPDDRISFEKFALNTERGNRTQTDDTFLGIYEYDDVGQRIKSPNHTISTTHHHDILLPLLYTSLPSPFLLNIYDDPNVSSTIDEILDCMNTSSSSSDHTCSTLSHFLESDDLSTIRTPIIELDSHHVVGFVGAMFSWESLFSTANQPDFDFQCSIQSDMSPIILTFMIKGGLAHATTEIIHPPPSKDGFWKQSSHSFLLNSNEMLVQDLKYTIIYYSSNTSPSSLFALGVGVSCVGVTLLISLIFLIFNILIARETFAVSLLLDSKRTYVRFVSHEIRSVILPLSTLLSHHCSHRTPLNTISLSIQILSQNLNELHEFHHKVHERQCDSLINPLNNNKTDRISLLIDECLDLINDLDESSSVAIVTLNDLINYDKIETKTFTIEEKDVNIWSVIEKTIDPLVFQAKEKKITMNLINRMTHDEMELDLECLRVIGDSIKLGQVVRNLVSNALKFTPPDGTVTISG
jgi:hypothetical protein